MVEMLWGFVYFTSNAVGVAMRAERYRMARW